MARQRRPLRTAAAALAGLGLLGGVATITTAGRGVLAPTARATVAADQAIGSLGGSPSRNAIKINPTRGHARVDAAAGRTVSLKPELTGLIEQDGMPSTTYLPAFSGFVVEATWAELQPTANGPIAADNVIDKAIKRVDKLNQEYPSAHLGIELRVNAGIDSPAWVMALDGGPTKPINDTSAGRGAMNVSGPVPKFWTADVGAAWSTFMKELAAKYDTAPEIRQANVMSRCMTLFSEPMVRQTDPTSMANLMAAGYTTAADESCQMQEIDEAKVWTHTYLSLNVNPYTVFNSATSYTKSDAESLKIMDYCRKELGNQCVLQNNEIGRAQNDTHNTLYRDMVALGAPLAFQTANAAELKAGIGFIGALNLAVQMKAADIEIETNSFDSYPESTLAAYPAKLAANGATTG